MAAALTVLFRADPLTPSRVDPHFTHEAAAVRELGGAVALVDHDALTAGDTNTAVRRVAPGLGHVWYRGWMITSSGYQALTAALDERNVALRTTPEQYRTAHELPGWYPAFAQATPASVWMPAEAGTSPSAAEVAQLIEPLGPLNKLRVELHATVIVEPALLQLGHGEPIGAVILLRLILAAIEPIDLVPQPLALDPPQWERAHSQDLAGQIGLDSTLTAQLPYGVPEWIQPSILRPRIVERHHASIRL